MVLHSALTGAHLHKPLGESSAGALDLLANTTGAYLARVVTAGTLMFAMDTTTSNHTVRWGPNLHQFNSDIVSTVAETCTLRMFGSNGTGAPLDVIYRNDITSGSNGVLTINLMSSLNGAGYAYSATNLHLGLSGLTGVNTLHPRLTFNGTTNAGAALTAYISVEYNSTQARGYFQLGTLYELKLANASSSFIIGGGTHGTYSTFADCTVIGDGANSTAASTSITGTTVVGSAALSLFNSGCAFGYQCAASAPRASCYGQAANASGDDSSMFGRAGSISGGRDFACAFGASASVSANGAQAYGFRAVSDTAHTAVFGGDDDQGAGVGGYLDVIYFGQGLRSANPDSANAETILTTTDSNGGTNNTSRDIVIRGGNGTGNSLGGRVILRSTEANASGASAQTWYNRVIVGQDIFLRGQTNGGSFDGLHIDTAFVQTTNNTPTTIWTSRDLAEGETAVLEITAVCRSTTESGGAKTIACWRRNTSGAAVQVGADSSIFLVDEVTGGNIALTTTGSSNGVAVQVTGVSGVTLNWEVSIQWTTRGATALA